MTLGEYVLFYASNSGVTVEWLGAHGFIAVPCACSWKHCRGWRMTHDYVGVTANAQG